LVALVANVAQVATVVHVGTVAQVATVVPRSSTAGTVLLFNNEAHTEKKTTLRRCEDQFVNSV
jgi:hypothetical protein